MDSNIFSRLPEMATKDVINCSVEITSSGMYVHLEAAEKLKGLTRFVLTKSGNAQYYQFGGNKWNLFSSLPKEECAMYGHCGAYRTCNSDSLDQFCSCVEGFIPKDIKESL